MREELLARSSGQAWGMMGVNVVSTVVYLAGPRPRNSYMSFSNQSAQ